MSHRLASLFTSVVVGSLAPVAGAVPATSPPCELVAASPAYRTDHTVVCTAAGPHIWISTDAARTWRRAPAAGFNAEPWISPNVVLVGAGRGPVIYAEAGVGLFVSRDSGQTFTLLDRVVSSGLPHQLVPMRRTLGTTSRDVLANADWTSTGLIDPQAGVRLPVVGSPYGVQAFLPPAADDPDSPVLVVSGSRLYGLIGGSGKSPIGVDACNDALVCAERKYSFPLSEKGWGTVDAWSTGRAENRAVYAALRAGGGAGGGLAAGVTGWRSFDGARTFAPWSNFALFVNSDRRYDLRRVEFALAHNPVVPRQIYLRVSRLVREDTPRSVGPEEALYRSDDAGTTWQRAAYAWSYARPGPIGGLPWSSFATEGHQRAIELAADGTLFATGWLRGGHRLAVFASTDNGRRWREAR